MNSRVLITCNTFILSLKWFIEHNIIYLKIKITSEKNSIFIPKNNCKVNKYQGKPMEITEYRSVNLIYLQLKYHIRFEHGFFRSNINCFRLKLTDIPVIFWTRHFIEDTQCSVVFLIDRGNIDFYYFTFWTNKPGLLIGLIIHSGIISERRKYKKVSRARMQWIINEI